MKRTKWKPFKVSKWAYLKLSPYLIIFLLTLLYLYHDDGESLFINRIIWVVSAVSLIGLVANILKYYHRIIWLNDEGVWYTQGVFPWTRRSTGILWGDLEKVSHKVGFFSWLTKAYTVNFHHRYSGNYFSVKGIHLGDKYVEIVNFVRSQ